MRVVQADPGVDGWWLLIEGDDGTSQLLHFPDVRGRKAPRPSVLQAQNKLLALEAVPDPPSLGEVMLELSDPLAEIEAAAKALDRADLSAADEARLDAALTLIGT